MAKLIMQQVEQNPEDSCACCDWAYYDGTPTPAQLKEDGGGRDGFTVPERLDNELSKRAGLERWLLSQSV